MRGSGRGSRRPRGVYFADNFHGPDDGRSSNSALRPLFGPGRFAAFEGAGRVSWYVFGGQHQSFADRRSVRTERIQGRNRGVTVFQTGKAGWSMPQRADTSAKIKPAAAQCLQLAEQFLSREVDDVQDRTSPPHRWRSTPRGPGCQLRKASRIAWCWARCSGVQWMVLRFLLFMVFPVWPGCGGSGDLASRNHIHLWHVLAHDLKGHRQVLARDVLPNTIGRPLLRLATAAALRSRTFRCMGWTRVADGGEGPKLAPLKRKRFDDLLPQVHCLRRTGRNGNRTYFRRRGWNVQPAWRMARRESGCQVKMVDS